MSNYDITFTVEIEENGQRRAYGDTYRSCTVESTQGIQKIELFCTEIFWPAISKKEYDALPKDGDNFGNHFAPYYTELKILNKVEWHEDGKNKVSYKVVSPSTC